MRKNNSKVRQLFCLLMVVCMVLGAVPTMTFAAEPQAEAVALNGENFPDENFRAYLAETVDRDQNGTLSEDEIKEERRMSVSNKNITDLKGVEYFSSLTSLDCSGNQLTSLDISQNPALTRLLCKENQLEQLNVSHNPELKYLICTENRLKSLDTTHNKKLAFLECGKNELEQLDVSHNPELEKLICGENSLKSLDTTHNEKLETLLCNKNQLKQLDVSQNAALTKLNCMDNQLEQLDVSQNPELIRLTCDANQLRSLDTTHNEKLSFLSCGNNQLESLNVSRNLKLTELHCSMNKLRSLDVSKNEGLTRLVCAQNLLTELNTTSAPALSMLLCDSNRLTHLDVSQNPNLVQVVCGQNPLSSLNLGKKPAMQMMSCNEGNLTSLDVSGCPSLKNLYCKNNRLKELDLSQNTALEFLNCSYNELSSLDLSNNAALKYRDCIDNRPTISARDGFDYTTLPGNFDVTKVSKVEHGSFDTAAHTFTLEEGYDNAIYYYDVGYGDPVAFTFCFNPFEDIVERPERREYYYDAVIWAVNNEITNGVTPTKFGPKNDCNRGQVVTFLWRAAGCPEPKTTRSPFKDVQDPNQFYYKAVLWAVENGITSGITPNTFKPNATCTRGQVVTFLWRFKGKPAPNSTTSPFSDVQDSGQYYYNAVLWAAENNITSGVTPTIFRHNGICNRGQIVTFLYRCIAK